MIRAAVAVALLALSGLVHGVWTHRWDSREQDTAAAVARIERIPLRVGDWEGERDASDALTLPEDIVGRGVSVRFVNKITGARATVFLACGPFDGLVGHTPLVCYPANGYKCEGADLRVSPTTEEPKQEFLASNFTKLSGGASTHVRVFWAWSDGNGWQVPGNPRRTFRRAAVVYKCHVIREVPTLNEPVEGDPGLQLLAALLPQLDRALSAP